MNELNEVNEPRGSFASVYLAKRARSCYDRPVKEKLRLQPWQDEEAERNQGEGGNLAPAL